MKQNLSIQNLLLSDIDLAIKWSNETESFINLKLLRDNCPCAFCSGEKDVFGNVYKGPKKKLVILGVSAWNLGQLEGEIDKGHWNLSEINENILFEKNNENKHIIATKNSFVRL